MLSRGKEPNVIEIIGRISMKSYIDTYISVINCKTMPSMGSKKGMFRGNLKFSFFMMLSVSNY